MNTSTTAKFTPDMLNAAITAVQDTISTVTNSVSSVKTCDALAEHFKAAYVATPAGISDASSLVVLTYKIFTNVNLAAASGFTDVPKWNKMGVAARRDVRIQKLNAFLSHLGTIKSKNVAPTPTPRKAPRNPAPRVKPAPVTSAPKASIGQQLNHIPVSFFDLQLACSIVIEQYRSGAASELLPAVTSAVQKLHAKRTGQVSPSTEAALEITRLICSVTNARDGGIGFADVDLSAWRSKTDKERATYNTAKANTLMAEVRRRCGLA